MFYPDWAVATLNLFIGGIIGIAIGAYFKGVEQDDKKTNHNAKK